MQIQVHTSHHRLYIHLYFLSQVLNAIKITGFYSSIMSDFHDVLPGKIKTSLPKRALIRDSWSLISE